MTRGVSALTSSQIRHIAEVIEVSVRIKGQEPSEVHDGHVSATEDAAPIQPYRFSIGASLHSGPLSHHWNPKD
jgi:hypothetical protein